MSRRRTAAALAAVAVVLVGLEAAGWLAGEEHHGGVWNSIPLFDLAFGFGGAAALWLLAKRLMGPLLSRRESWSDNRRGDPS